MSTMRDDGDKICPLCTEEMDLTDQQLKPCKCGYEICVWCWHHLMEMAEKEDSEGLCPACRTAYNKGRIVGMAANCERMVAELSAERRSKSQKAKSKASAEARKQLNDVRVVKRNLVYIVGLPSNLADESTLEREEYFGQYGKVLKVSISRPAGTTTFQQASNKILFNVYVTFAREEEAIRCIQAVHNFILEGQPLKASFGTTKYCHSWLRNMICTNPDCLYLHDVGSQEDSFNKDEIISAYTRGRVQQSASNILQRQSGNVLPPPDDFCNNGTVSGKHVPKIATNTAASQVKASPSISNFGRSAVLPSATSWGSHVPISLQTAASVESSQNPVKQKNEMINSSPTLSSSVPRRKQSSAWNDDDADVSLKMPKRVHMKGRSTAVQSPIPSIGYDIEISTSDASLYVTDEICPSAWDDEVVTSPVSVGTRALQSETMKPAIDTKSTRHALAPEAEDEGINMIYPVVTDKKSSSVPVEDSNDLTLNTNMQNLCSRLGSFNCDKFIGVDSPSVDKHQTSVSSYCSTSLSSNLLARPQKYNPEQGIQCIASTSPGRTVNSYSHGSIASYDQRHNFSRVNIVSNDPSNSFRNNDAEYTRFSPLISEFSKHGDTDVNRGLVSFTQNGIIDSNAYNGENLNSPAEHGKVFEHPNMNNTEREFVHSGRFDNNHNIGKTGNVDSRVSSIITDMFSLDFDPWEESFSTNDFSNFLGKISKQEDSSKLPIPWKSQNSNQSRFSFAQQENERKLLGLSHRNTGDANQLCSLSKEDSFEGGIQNGSNISNFMAPNLLLNINSVASSDVPCGPVRAKNSAPPGFPVPSRASPPGFSSHDRHGGIYETDNHLVGNSYILNQRQSYSAENAGDVELIDPAILAVGKGILPPGMNYSQFSTSDSDTKLLLLKQSISAHQEPRITGHTDRLLPLNNAYVLSRLRGQNYSRQLPLTQILNQQPRASHVLSSHWDGWNGIETGNDVGMAEVLRNSRRGIGNYFPVNDENQFHG